MNRTCSSLEVKPRSFILMPANLTKRWVLELAWFFLLHFFSSSYCRGVVSVTIPELWLPSLLRPQHRTTSQLSCCASRICQAVIERAILKEVPRTLDLCRPEYHFEIPPCDRRPFVEIVRFPDESSHVLRLHHFRVARRYLSRADSNLTPFSMSWTTFCHQQLLSELW